MNSNMAEGAAQRLVAQIAEGLFGQPGLTLMELAEKVKASQPTPSSRWAAMGEPDPHGSRYDCERAALVMGNLTDDELANAVFLHGNEQPTMAQIAAGAMLPISYLTAAKDRIRWLSRALVAAEAKNAARPSPVGQGDALPPLPPEVDAVRCMIRGEEDLSEACDYYYTAEQMRAYALTALTARQPVGAADKHSLTVGGGQTLVQEPAGWQTMASCPRDGTAILLRWGEDHVSPGWWCADASPIQNEDGTWSSDNGGFPWAFFDLNDGVAFVNHAVDTEYGPTHWAPYVYPPARAVDLGEFRDLIGFATYHAINLPETDPRRDFIRQANEFLALIDGNAAAGEPNTAPNRLTDQTQAVDLSDFKNLYRAYVRLLESGRDRINDLGGSCDPVDVMEANDLDLQAARRVIDSKAVG